ncbi:MAG: hypothetical protein FJ025_00070 [Chloroflexi bacterium]|nr:hypothetical protein [Chloroflexota bacterium]
MAEIYTTQCKLHRSNVTAVDASDPADTSGAVNTAGYKECRFDTTLTGTNFNSLEVQVLFWNPRQQKWMGGGKRTFTSTGQHALVVDCRGAIIFLKVTAFSGTSFSLSADYTLS